MNRILQDFHLALRVLVKQPAFTVIAVLTLALGIGANTAIFTVAHEVIGVMPRTFKDPFNLSSLWRVFPTEGGENFVATSRYWSVVGRTKPGVAASTAQAEIETIGARLAQSDPKFHKETPNT